MLPLVSSRQEFRTKRRQPGRCAERELAALIYGAVRALSTLICAYTGCPDTGYASVCANRLSLYAKVPIVGVCLSFGLILGMVAIQDGWHALANGCMLKMTLTVKDTQDGFAGTTGTVWMIEPDCTFRVSRLFGPHVAEPHLKGALTPEQQARLSAVLAKTAVSELPAQIGDATQVNAHRITLQYGGKDAVLSLGSGDRDLDAIRAGDPRDPARRLLEVADMVQDILGRCMRTDC